MEKTKLKNVINIVAIVMILVGIALRFVGYKAGIHISCAIVYLMYIVHDVKLKEKSLKYNILMFLLWTFLAIVKVFDL